MKRDCYHSIITWIGCICLTLSALTAGAQADTAVCKPSRKWLHNIYQQAWNSIQRSPDDTCEEEMQYTVLNARGEDLFMPYKGLIVRHILVSDLGFERNFADTSARITSLASRAAAALHRNTRPWVVRQNMFVREGELLDPFKVADNERFLRRLDFFQDARILVQPVAGSHDSVDLLVITKDVFSLKAVVDASLNTDTKVRVAENNFLGMGQKLQGTVSYKKERSPHAGYELQYAKNNIGGSFINGLISYNNIDNGKSLGLEEEEAWFLRFERPLVSPYTYYAGALELGTNRSLNVYSKPDSLFQRYHYTNFDLWVGYNLLLSKVLREDPTIRDRKFLAVRYFSHHFQELPQNYEQLFDPIYNDKQAILGQMTFFRQEFIKTQYIYGFGVTEDVPYGYNVSFTGGWWKQRNLARPYTGVNLDYYTASPQGSFCQYYLRSGVFFHEGQAQDAALLIGASYFSKLFFSGDFKIRQYLRATYSQIFNRIIYEPLYLNNNYFGLREFGTDRVWGSQRIALQTETSFFTRYKLHGFKFAPFIYADAALLRGDGLPMNKSDIYPGIGGGLRTRNESLIFGTIELKAIWFPRPVDGLTTFRVTVNSDIRFKYNTNYINPPDIARLNYDLW